MEYLKDHFEPDGGLSSIVDYIEDIETRFHGCLTDLDFEEFKLMFMLAEFYAFVEGRFDKEPVEAVRMATMEILTDYFRAMVQSPTYISFGVVELCIWVAEVLLCTRFAGLKDQVGQLLDTALTTLKCKNFIALSRYCSTHDIDSRGLPAIVAKILDTHVDQLFPDRLK